MATATTQAAKIDPFEHVEDSSHFEFFDTIGWSLELGGNYKFMLLLGVAALLLVAVLVPIGRRARNGQPPKGRLWNAVESMMEFIRDDVARDSIGEHDYKRFLPFLWTMFFFVMTVNLLGMLPFTASATASLAVTGVLSLIVFCVIHYNGIVANHGVVGYFKTFVPTIERNDIVLKIIGPFIVIGITALEILGAFIRAFVLAVRLFANMLAGHTVLFIMMLFIRMVGESAALNPDGPASYLFWPIVLGDVVLVTALSMLELLVAVLQAFVFTFLTAVFIGLALHPEH